GTWQEDTEYEIGDTIRIPRTPQFTDSWVYRVINRTERDGQPGFTTTLDPMMKPNFEPLLGNVVEDNDLTWICVDNRIGLRAMRITIRYVDQKSRLPKQMTILHSFAK